ncbi:MAG: hypothetical protein ACREYC_28955, partial [Gammaproteobacteria bacterium]
MTASNCSKPPAPHSSPTASHRASPADADHIGVYNPLTGTFFLKLDGNPVLQVGFGKPEKVPLIGDWDGDGLSTVGVYDPASATFFVKNK